MVRLLQLHSIMRARAGIWRSLVVGMVLASGCWPATAWAAERSHPQSSLYPLYKLYGSEYDVDWAVLAAIDRYAELTKTKTAKQEAPYYGFSFYPAAWAGIANPNADDMFAPEIQLFGGLGQDANGDMLALPFDPADRIKALAHWLDMESGEDEEIAIWNLFQDPVAMDRIDGFARLFRTFGLSPTGSCFPIDKRYNYTVKHTFGAGRSYGGRRIHEGVDIFASYGTPVLACSYGYVELMGWNRFGGWRIGIRDANNMYYYYAHLSSFQKGLHQGDLVRPGQVIGYVGSSGYGPPGTSGKFPPHLHFGIYKDTGLHEWAFSPSGYLSQWERQKQHVTRETVLERKS
ncbi:M23 family metallopeptidase [Alicyclobacillus hesperidum]|uniref:M23 family metallopeptidase n=1 Tax=Alicyclobacillus hesperidum TaxID=89784 RepID=UPI0024E0EA30|nr:M23 family metallopeptidase [Alicyclobacillus hesperidum]